MYCKNCGKELPNDSNFCPKCGEKQNDNAVDKNVRILKFINDHKKLSYTYIIWFLVHLALYINSSKHNQYNQFNRYKGNQEGFYPWNKPLNEILTYLGGEAPNPRGEWEYKLSWLDEYNVYDSYELFFYTILLPVIIYGLTKCWSYISTFTVKKSKKIKEKNCQCRNLKKENFVAEKNLPEEQLENFSISQAETDENKKIKPMPLLNRLFGTLIDKILLGFIFAIGYLVISPYGAAEKMGTYVGLLNSSPDSYEYIDMVRISNYNKLKPGVSEDYQAKERLANGVPYIGYTQNSDVNITVSFIILNLIYYMLFEYKLHASFGKYCCGGILLNTNKKKIGLYSILTRALLSACFMLIAVFGLHFKARFSYYEVIGLYFFSMDIPILFTKRSLLDLCTGTRYAKMKFVTEWHWWSNSPEYQ